MAEKKEQIKKGLQNPLRREKSVNRTAGSQAVYRAGQKEQQSDKKVPVSKEVKKQQPMQKAERKKSERKAFMKPDFHMLFIGVMGVFVVFVMGWGICQTVKVINTADQTTEETVQPIKKIEDNSENAGKTFDVDELIQKILDHVAFEVELNKLDDTVAEGMVETTEGTRLQIYMGNGTFADELLVMTAKNETDAKKNREYAAAHLEETKSAFRAYLPKEAEKIENAVSIRCGCYVIVCVTSDYETAEQTINSMIKD